MLTQQIAKDIARTYELQGSDLRVLIFLLGDADASNRVHIHHAQIAAELSTPDHAMPRQTVTKAVNHLVKAGILIKDEFRNYRINAVAGWKGLKTQQVDALRTDSKFRLDLAKPVPPAEEEVS